jgi:predicted transcriptional regulator
MDPELSKIKQIRKKLGITQSELAKRANVSQSLIAKVESGRLDPTYSNAKKIFQALENLNAHHEMTANEVMQSKIISASQREPIKEVIKKMKKYEISQLPVIEDHKSIGTLSETSILDAIINGKSEAIVSDIMQDAAPVVSKSTNINLISNLLKFFPMVLVAEKGKILGLITKQDLIRKIYE